MNKTIITLILLFVGTAIVAQEKSHSINIEWDKTISNSQQQWLGWINDHSLDISISGLVPTYYIPVELGENQTIENIVISDVIEEGLVLDTNTFEAVSRDIQANYTAHLLSRKGINKILISTARATGIPFVVNRLNSLKVTYNIVDKALSYDEKEQFSFSTSSVINEGEWYQFSISASGIYRITYDQLSEAGIDVSAYSSDQIKMYGFGGMLPESSAEFRHPDIPEIAIQMEDGGDGVFNNGDYFIFYAQGPDTWSYSESNQSFSHRTNIYERLSYYYLSLSPGNGKRINSLESNQTANFSTSSYFDHVFIEDETYNLINSGRRWFGDKFEFTTEYDYGFNFPNIKTNSDIQVKAVMAARSTVSSSFSVSVLDESENVSIPRVSTTSSYPPYANGGQANMTINSGSNAGNFNININYSQPLTSSVGWLDYIEVITQNNLIFSNGQLFFRNPETIKPGRITEFTIQNNAGSAPEIWDITQINNPYKINFQNSASQLTFTTPTEELKEFVVFDNTSFMRASFVKSIENQNLHAELNHDYIIVCPDIFIDQANELAEFHREYSKLDVFVTTLEPIYHEFSSGKQDISAIRDFLRAVNKNSDNKLKYLLLFGDASMDYLNRSAVNTNMVPTWQSYESFDPVSSIATDDFFSFLDDDEGEFLFGDPDIGVGRFPVINVAEAQAMVDKIKHYKSADTDVMNDWRNNICFIADDEDGNLHVDQANDLSILVDSIYKTANLDKIYVDAFTQESTPAGQRYPKVNEAINERIKKGSLIISYTGHGGEVGWGQERFLDIPDINSWDNYDKLPVFITATCEFARYDDPDRVSAGELIFLNEEGGGIALFTTSRATYAGSNFKVSTQFFNHSLVRADGQNLTLGEILKRTKLATGNSANSSKFVLLGDPALTMNLPEKNVVVTSIINNETNLETDTLQALSEITIKGEIRDENGQRINDFNGTAYPTVFDKATLNYTLGQDPNSSIYDFELQKNILYRGVADVQNGEFEVSFIVPKDITYKYGQGKISLYAENGVYDASGYNQDVIIGGFNENAAEDNEGPEITLFINNTNFQNGGMTDENPVLLAFITDDNGINTTGNGIGHDISAKLDDDGSNLKVLNDFYVADANNYKSGSISFPFFNVSDGPHTIELKVWDIHNNSSKASIDFVVTSSGSIALDDLFNYPNPVIDQTTFSFEHNQSGEDLQISIDIYSIDGKFVRRIEENFQANSYRSNEIVWDATDQYGNRLRKGIYVYKVLVKLSDGKQASKTNRLVVIK